MKIKLHNSLLLTLNKEANYFRFQLNKMRPRTNLKEQWLEINISEEDVLITQYEKCSMLIYNENAYEYDGEIYEIPTIYDVNISDWFYRN